MRIIKTETLEKVNVCFDNLNDPLSAEELEALLEDEATRTWAETYQFSASVGDDLKVPFERTAALVLLRTGSEKIYSRFLSLFLQHLTADAADGCGHQSSIWRRLYGAYQSEIRRHEELMRETIP